VADRRVHEVTVVGVWRGKDVLRLGHHVARTQEEVLAELLSTLGAEAEAEAELRVEVRLPDGVTEDTLRIVLDNANALGVRITIA
jgi:hypothetical protein